MNTFKSFCMLLVLIGVGYGVYRSMHLKNPTSQPQGVDTSIPEIDLQIGSSGDPGVAPRFTESGPTTLPAREGRRDGLIGRPFDFGSTAARDPKPETPSASEPNTSGMLLPPPNKYEPPTPLAGAMPATTPIDSTPNTIPNAMPAIASSAPPTTVLPLSMPAKPDPAMNMMAGGSITAPASNDVQPATSLQPEPFATKPQAKPNAALSPFGPVMKETQKLIDDRKLAEALQRLTRIYDDASMSEIEQAQTLDMLNQLAGTVIYSNEHWLGEAHKIGAGETLESIAKQNRVPWEVLAKINGLVDPKQLPVGELIKVVPGPFRAEISLESKRLTLFLNEMYAGSFDIVSLGRESQYGESDYLVQKRSLNPIYDNAAQGQRFAEGDPQNPLGNFAVMLADGLVIHGHGAQVAPNDPRGSLRLSARDSEDVHDILSEGSKVTIKR